MGFSKMSTVRQVLADDAARAVLERHIPGVSAHPQLPAAMDMTLSEVASYPEAGISPEKFAALIADLEKVR